MEDKTLIDKADNIWDYDIEVFPNLFSATFWNGKEEIVFSLFNGSNQLQDFVEWIKSKKSLGGLTLVGYNNHKYDDPIINSILSNWYGGLDQLSNSEINTKLYKLSKLIVSDDKKKSFKERDYIKSLCAISPRIYLSIDLLEVIREGYATKSLKGVAINLKHPKIQDLPYHFDKVLTKEEGEEVIKYNLNDVLVTTKIRQYIRERLEMRRILSQQFGVNLLSDADSTIAKTLFNKFYSEKSGKSIEEFRNLRTNRKELRLNDIILPWITFKTTLYQEWFEKLKRVRVWNIEGKQLQEGYEEDEFGELIKVKKTKAVQFNIPKLESEGMIYNIGLGGIHSKDKPGIFTNEDVKGVSMMLLDVDVASQYPRRIIHSEIVPAHLNPKLFVEVLELIVDTRLKNKKLGKVDDIARIVAEGLKITVNTVYGLYNFAYYFLYDPLATYKVTINNQLAILMLIEELNLNGIKIISANTDGIIIYSSSSNIGRIREIYSLWEQTTGFTLEETLYSRYIRRDINNYITIKTNGEVKNKGIFIPQNGILKGYDKPIVAIALQEYFLHGVKPEEVIGKLGYEYLFVNPDFPHGETRKTDIYDYCMAKKVGDTFEGAELHHINKQNEDSDNDQIIITSLQKNLRYYASNSGDTIYKVKKEDGKPDSLHNLLVSSPITLFNDYVEKSSVEEYNINIEYYLDEIYKIIYKIEGKKWISKEAIGKNKAKLDAKVLKLQESLTSLQVKERAMMMKNKTHLKTYTTLLNQIIKKEDEVSYYLKQKDNESK